MVDVVQFPPFFAPENYPANTAIPEFGDFSPGTIISGGVDAAQFTLVPSARGVKLAFNFSPDFENPVDAFTELEAAAGPNSYQVVLQGPSGPPVSMIVNVTDVAEGPVGPVLTILPFPPALAADEADNLAYVGNGAHTAVASSVYPSQFQDGQHTIAHINDGHYGNSFSWIPSFQEEASNAWLKIDLGAASLISEVLFGRDRTGVHGDRAPEDYTISVATSDDVYADGNTSNDATEYSVVFTGSVGTLAAGATIANVFSAPVSARYIKIDFPQGNTFGVAIDEVQVHGTGIAPNTAPTITSNGGLAAASVSIYENSTLVTTVVATDTDLPSQTLTYSISGGEDQSLFEIRNSNEVHFKLTPDFDALPATGATPGYQVTVQVVDGQGGIDTQIITVAVDNVPGVAVTSNAAVITGGGEEDTLTGGAGTNKLVGVGGNDLLDGGTGRDTMEGGGGDDTYIVDSTDKVIEFVDGGHDTVRTGLVLYTLTANVEDLEYIGGGAFKGTGNDLANAILGGVNNDSLAGAAGNDTLTGSGGNDRLNGDAGDDELTGGTGNDSLNGGADNDQLNGGDDSDTLAGDAGNDRLNGDAGNDTQTGGAGNDTLAGGEGDDRMGGGADADLFIVGQGIDTLTDLNHADDTIQLDQAFFANVIDGDNNGFLDASDFFVGKLGAAGYAGQHIIYDNKAYKLYYDADGIVGGEVQFASVLAKPLIAADDFALSGFLITS